MNRTRFDVDSPPPVNCLEWFYGGGGNHLGLARVIPGLRLIAACEIEAYAIANVVAQIEAGYLDPFPLWPDVKTFPLETFRGFVDLFVASYPCQGFSVAGKREGERDPRFLWPWVFQAVVVIRPRRVFFENVEGHITLGLSTVLSDLEAAGYRCAWGIFSAEECGASHRRERVFVMADASGLRRREKRSELQGRNGVAAPQFNRDTMADAGGEGLSRRSQQHYLECETAERSGLPRFAPGPGELKRWQQPLAVAPYLEPALCRVADGMAYRVDRLRLCGNGVVPDTAALAYVTLDLKLSA